VEISVAPGLPPVRIDRSQVERALLNLVVNARDASRQAQQKCILLSVTTRSFEDYVSFFQPAAVSGEFVVVSVRDRGCGISREDFGRVFSPFYTTKDEGNGLGLTSVLQAMQSHGGWVELDSEAGEGSCFSLYFPLAVPQTALEFVQPSQLVHA
jgi:signal transduction histidine kinase